MRIAKGGGYVALALLLNFDSKQLAAELWSQQTPGKLCPFT